MKPSFVYEIILVALHVLNALYVVASANNVARDNSNEKGQKSLNNQDNMYISTISWNILANHSLSQMWTCVQHPQSHNNVRTLSVQILNNGSLHKSIRVLISMPITKQMQSNENTYIKMSAMNISTYTSGILSKSCSLTYKSVSQRYITMIEKSNEKKNVHGKKQGRFTYNKK
ncbi:hypothetical protein RFI_03059 [Reticulomyxa filosa]|uniref:Uncharacterized protein n=1 Tax=Reticulomyxa filosa TaxID=46433 RepID=X6P7J3_RETFI|nr:hypothetical protein RFI_03059 [Reticulomyxa filosa]|eukprot:ETO34034.1 hypothetical protein RFI_03059 [Reticulomyxa filosa]